MTELLTEQIHICRKHHAMSLEYKWDLDIFALFRNRIEKEVNDFSSPLTIIDCRDHIYLQFSVIY
jgi:hypothetical protein